MDERNVQGMSYECLYSVYSGMMSRCYNKNHPHYDNWGGRGIKVCDQWRYDYQAFRKWALYAGYDEEKDRKYQMLERIDNDGDYCPENCKWATAHEQNLNRRYLGRKTGAYKHNWTFEGITKSAIEWCEIFGVSVPMVMYRVKTKGMKPFEALVTPVNRADNLDEITEEKVRSMRDSGMKIKEIADFFGCSKNTIERRLGKRK